MYTITSQLHYQEPHFVNIEGTTTRGCAPRQRGITFRGSSKGVIGDEILVAPMQSEFRFNQSRRSRLPVACSGRMNVNLRKLLFFVHCTEYASRAELLRFSLFTLVLNFPRLGESPPSTNISRLGLGYVTPQFHLLIF